MNEKTCIYCGKEADTREHVPARCLLEKPYPANLYTLPSCSKCNKSYSLDEEFFLATLAQIGTRSSLTEKIEDGGIVDRAFLRSPALERRFLESMEIGQGERVFIRPELNRINRVIQKTAFGLFIIRYDKIPLLSDIKNVVAYPYNIMDSRPPARILATHTEKFAPKRWDSIQKGIFSFIVVRDKMADNCITCIMDFHETLWGVVEFPEPSAISRRGTKKPRKKLPGQGSLFEE